MRLFSTFEACGEPRVHQRLHVGERVEQEVRLDLRLQQAQPRIRLAALELAALELERQRLLARERVALPQDGADGDPRRKQDGDSHEQMNVVLAAAARDGQRERRGDGNRRPRCR